MLGTQGLIQTRQVSSLPVNSSYMWKLLHVEKRASPFAAVKHALSGQRRGSHLLVLGVGGCFLVRSFSKYLARVLKADKGVKKPDSQKEEH